MAHLVHTMGSNSDGDGGIAGSSGHTTAVAVQGNLTSSIGEAGCGDPLQALSVLAMPVLLTGIEPTIERNGEIAAVAIRTKTVPVLWDAGTYDIASFGEMSLKGSDTRDAPPQVLQP